MKFVIWGTGERGKRIFPHIGEENVIAFIDSNSEKAGNTCLGKNVISPKAADKEILDHCIIITPLYYENEIIEELEEKGIDTYLLMRECPGDLQSPYARDCLKKHICGKIQPNLRYVVYGSNLYSIMVFEWIRERTSIPPHLVLTEKVREGLSQLLKREYGEYVLFDIAGLDGYDKFFNTEREPISREECGRRGIDFSKKEEIFDCSREIDEYYNEKICRFKDIHRGQRCFIIALGPSLKVEDLDKLYENKELCISMNDIWRVSGKTLWRPDYFVADDYRVWSNKESIFEFMKKGYCFIGDTDSELCEEQIRPENALVHHVSFDYTTETPSEFSDDFSRNCYLSGSVTISCLQLAAYMGITEIYLLGADFSYAGSNNKYEKYEHFYKEEQLTAVGFSDEVYMGYLGAKKYSDEHQIKIYNATRGGKLEVFERVNFDDLFSAKNNMPKGHPAMQAPNGAGAQLELQVAR